MANGNLCLGIPPEDLFYWKLLRIGIRSANDIRKDGLIFQVWWSAPVPATPPVFRVVLYHTEASGQRLLRRSVSIYFSTYNIQSMASDWNFSEHSSSHALGWTHIVFFYFILWSKIMYSGVAKVLINCLYMKQNYPNNRMCGRGRGGPTYL